MLCEIYACIETEYIYSVLLLQYDVVLTSTFMYMLQEIGVIRDFT